MALTHQIPFKNDIFFPQDLLVKAATCSLVNVNAGLDLEAEDVISVRRTTGVIQEWSASHVTATRMVWILRRPSVILKLANVSVWRVIKCCSFGVYLSYLCAN